MSVIIMKNTSLGRRAYAISREQADQLVADGKAVQDKVHGGIYEELTDEEISQNYQTRNMMPLDFSNVKRGRGRPAKPRAEDTASSEA